MYAKKYAFVTVGTTQFQPLVQVASSKEFVATLKKLNFQGLLLQIGESNSVPTNALEESAAPSSTFTNGEFFTLYYTLKPDIRDDIKNAALIISHAGAGTIMESLLASRPLIVVSNSSLMNNHQLELANKMASLKHLWHATSPDQLHTLVQEDHSKLKPFPYGRNSENQAFDHFLYSILEKSGKQKMSSMVVLGSGGHTAEMFRMLRSVDRRQFPIQYVVAASDTHSMTKVREFEKIQKESDLSSVVRVIPRSRKVHQSYFTSIFTTLWSFLCSMLLIFRTMPDLVLCNGPGTCVPVCIAALLLRIFFLKKVRMVYVESIARVHTLSLSGKILMPVVDHFVVQWQELKEKYPKKTTFLGIVV